MYVVRRVRDGLRSQVHRTPGARPSAMLQLRSQVQRT
jgi:hypothetical protein